MKTSRCVLEPYHRVSEVLFGLIMALTITGSLSVADAGRDDVRTMLIGALGCDLAWGIIDGLLYLMGCLNEKANGIRSLRALRKAVAPADGNRLIAFALPPMVAATLGPEQFDFIRQKLLQLPAPPSRPRLGKRQWHRVEGCILLGDLHHSTGNSPVHLHDKRRASHARLQRDCHYAALRSRLGVRVFGGSSTVADRAS